MLRPWFLTCAAVLVCPSVLAGSFADLKPGVSTRADVERVLGPPLKEEEPGGFVYDPTRHQAKAIVVYYAPGSDVVFSIEVHTATTYPKSSYQEWFGLGEPARAGSWCDGNWGELYVPQDMVLCFAGVDATSPVVAYVHVHVPPTFSALPSAETADPGSLDSSGVEAYFGVLISGHTEQGILVSRVGPGSPAEAVGLQSGDVILEFGDATFYRSGVETAELSALMAARPPGHPVRVLFERGAERYQGQIVPEAKDETSINEIRRNLFLTNYHQGRTLWSAGKHDEAIPYLETAADYQDQDSGTWMLLGSCHFTRGRNREALGAYSRALALTPESPAARYSVAYCYDRLGNREKAAAFYRAYLSAHDRDSERIERAKKRLKSFSPKEKGAIDWGALMLDVAGAISAEVADP